MEIQATHLESDFLLQALTKWDTFVYHQTMQIHLVHWYELKRHSLTHRKTLFGVS